MRKIIFIVPLFISFLISAQDCNQYLVQFQNEFRKKDQEIEYGVIGESGKYDKSKFESVKKYVTYYLACKADEVGYDNATLLKLKNAIDFIYREDTHLIIAGVYDENKSLDKREFPNTYYVINSNFQIISQFDSVLAITLDDAYNKEIYFVTRNKKTGIIDKNGNEIVAPLYDKIYWYKEGRAVINNNNKSGFIDTSGNEIVSPKYDSSRYTFSDDYLTVYNGKYPTEKFGLVDKDGNEIIAPQYEFAGNFFGGLWPVYKDKKWGFVNSQNEVIIPFKYDMIGGSDGNFYGYTENGVWYYVVQKNYKGKSEIINKKGETFKTLADVRD